MATAPTPADLQGFRAVFETAVEVSPALALAVAGGVRQRAVPISLGAAKKFLLPASCTTIMAMFTETTTMSEELGFLCVV